MQPVWRDVTESTIQYRNIRIEHWLNESLFSYSWWIILVTTVGIFIVWLIILDKKRIFEIIAYGFFVTVIAVIADAVGTLFMLWQYPNALTPLSINIEIHIVQMPIIYMIIYQYFHTWKSFLMVTIMNAFIFSFMLEPLLVWLQVYEPYQWKHIYSFFPYIIIAVGLKLIVHKLKQMDQNDG